MSEYKTVKKTATAEYVDRRSKFIGAVIPVETEQQALDFIAKRKSETYGARHNVYAYILRENNLVRYSDDGEPHSTAGMPTLDVLKKSGLTDVCLVTTRYFGGVLLGTGGLVHAYTSAAKMAIDEAGIAVMKKCFSVSAECAYNDHRKLEQIITDFGAKIENTEFTDTVKVLFSVQSTEYDKLIDKIIDGLCGRVEPKIEGEIWADLG